VAIRAASFSKEELFAQIAISCHHELRCPDSQTTDKGDKLFDLSIGQSKCRHGGVGNAQTNGPGHFLIAAPTDYHSLGQIGSAGTSPTVRTVTDPATLDEVLASRLDILRGIGWSRLSAPLSLKHAAAR
jgi:hypothetical protein